MLRIAFKSPFETNFKLSAQSDKPSLATPSPNLERSEKWQVATAIRCCAASELEIEKVELEQSVRQVLCFFWSLLIPYSIAI